MFNFHDCTTAATVRHPVITGSRLSVSISIINITAAAPAGSAKQSIDCRRRIF